MSAAHFRDAAEFGGGTDNEKLLLRLVKLFN
jgi:hypothetical protein